MAIMMTKLFPLIFLCLTQFAWASPEIQHWTTPNGTRVYFVEAHELPIVDIEIVFDAGSTRDAGKGGVATLTNGMLAEGAGGLNTDQILEQFATLGVEFGNDLDLEMSSFSIRSLRDPKLLEPALDLFATILSQPDFPANAFKREQKRLLHSIEYQKQRPGSVASKAFYRAVYGSHPYAFPEEGTQTTVSALTLSDLKAFYQRYYVANNAIIAMVGDLSRADAEHIAANLLKDLPAGKAAPPLPEVAPVSAAQSIHIQHPSSQTHVLIGQTGYSRYVEDYFVMFVGNHILGGSSLVSILGEEVREKRGLSYSVYSYFAPMSQAGPFVLGLQTKNKQADEAVNVALDTLRDFVTKGPTEKQLADVKKNLTGGFPLRIDSNAKVLGYISVIGFYKLPLNYLDVWTDRVEAVTLEQIRDSFQRRLQLDKLIQLTVGGDPE
jgi:zinc protease